MRDNERLGRRVSESGKNPREFKRIQQNIASGISENVTYPCTYRTFKPKAGELAISVDRLDLDLEKKVAEIAKRDAKHANRIFYGWGVILHSILIQKGFKAHPSPSRSNPYHADLLFPDDIKNSRERNDQIKENAEKLAQSAKWLECPK